MWLMTAYHIADPPHTVPIVTEDGSPGESFVIGRDVSPLPPCPWADAEVTRQRNALIEVEVEAFRAAHRKDQTA